MRYLSEDGQVFNTEQECYAHEQEMCTGNVVEIERKQKMAEINKKWEEVQQLISEYRKEYGVVVEMGGMYLHESSKRIVIR